MKLSQILAIIISVFVFNGIVVEVAFNQLLQHVDTRIDAKVDPHLIKELDLFPWEDIFVDSDSGWLYVREESEQNWLGLPDKGWYLASNP